MVNKQRIEHVFFRRSYFKWEVVFFRNGCLNDPTIREPRGMRSAEYTFFYFRD